MELFNNLALGFSTATSIENLFFCLIGVLLGTLIGVLPGIGATATIAMLLPITFQLEPVSSLIMLAGIYRGALRVMDGEGFSLGQLFDGYSKMHVILASIFISVATGIATVLCYLPGVLIAFLTSFTLFFIVDQEMEAAEAIAASVKMVWHNFGKTLLFFLLAAIVVLIGAILCGVGLLVAVPVVVFGAAYTYRKLAHPIIA